MISYERGIIFLTYPPIQAALPSAHRARWRRKNWMRKNLQHSWRVYMVEKVNYLLHSYTTCHHVFYSYDSLLILFPTLWRSEFVSLRTPLSPYTTYHVVLTFFLVLWYDWMLKLYGKKEREKSEHSTTFHLPEYNSTTSSASASGNVNNTSGALGLGRLVKVLNNTLFRLLSTAQAVWELVVMSVGEALTAEFICVECAVCEIW